MFLIIVQFPVSRNLRATCVQQQVYFKTELLNKRQKQCQAPDLTDARKSEAECDHGGF